MASYDISKHFEKIKNMDWLEMIKDTSREVERIISFSAKRKAQEPESKKYLLQLRSFLYFLRERQLAGGVSIKEIDLYKDIAQRLIDKDQWMQGVMDIFDQD